MLQTVSGYVRQSKFGPLAKKTKHFAKIIQSSDQRKYSFRWLKSMKKNYLIDTPSAWLTFGAIDYLENHLRDKTNLKVFEFGSGGSTLYWLSKGLTCVSIEHDPEWFQVLKGKLKKSDPVDYRLVLPEKREVEAVSTNPADPTTYSSTFNEYNNMSFQTYASQIDQYPDQSFDIILIDGRARPSCLYHSLAKVKPGGLIILDNAEREHYQAVINKFIDKGFERKEFFGIVPNDIDWNRTDIYRKLG